MKALADTQTALADALTSSAMPWSDAVLGAVVPGGSLDHAGALEVYRTGYVARLTEQLGETYATVWRVLGDDGFFALCARYIAGHASTSYNLSDYGRGFAAFLEGSDEAADAPFLVELAGLELAFHDVFHAAAHTPVDTAALASLGCLDGVRFVFGSSVRVLSFERAVHTLFRHRNDEAMPDVDIDVAEHVVLYKDGEEVLARTLDAASQCALAALARGAAIDEALERAAAFEPSFGPVEASRLFELIARCRLVERIESSS